MGSTAVGLTVPENEDAAREDADREDADREDAGPADGDGQVAVRMIVGLGNPGPRYAITRHNIGFMVVDRLAAEGGGRWVDDLGCSCTAAVEMASTEVLLVKPQTFMNRSGEAAAALAGRREMTPEQVLVVLDDFLLDFGRLRARRGGSDGGHNGLASVLERLGSAAAPRLRMGIGPVPEGEDDIDFVLAPFDRRQDVDGLVDRGCRAVECLVAEGVEAAMNRFNGCPPLEPVGGPEEEPAGKQGRIARATDRELRGSSTSG